MFSFQGSWILHAIIYRCPLILFPVFSFTRKISYGKCCCTHFEILPLFPQTYFPLLILMEVLMYLTEHYLSSNWSLYVWATFLIATTFKAIVKPFWPDYVIPISCALSCPECWLMEKLWFRAQFSCHWQQLHRGRQRWVWPFMINLGYFLLFAFNFHLSVWDSTYSQMLFVFRTSSCCDLTLNDTSVAAIPFYALNVNFSLG